MPINAQSKFGSDDTDNSIAMLWLTLVVLKDIRFLIIELWLIAGDT